jgi:hypothetical protein
MALILLLINGNDFSSAYFITFYKQVYGSILKKRLLELASDHEGKQ